MPRFDAVPVEFAPERSVTKNLTRVFLDEPVWDVRRHNTDGRYVTEILPQLARYEPQLQFVMERSKWVALRENFKIVRLAAQRRLGRKPAFEDHVTCRLGVGELERSGADVVFSHRAFPVNAGSWPVIWQQSVLDPVMQRSYGVSEAEIAEEVAVKGALFRRATQVHLSTEAEVRRLAGTFPEIAERFVAVPFFTPHASACARGELERQLEAKPVRLLFVGRQAWRKGLDLLLEAFTALPAAVRERAELTIISNFEHGKVVEPQSERIRVIHSASRDEVLAEMKRSHLFVNVARFESYGLVFHEAMSQGLACLAPDWEVQRELFADGAAGMLLTPDAESIREALAELIGDDAKRYALALAGWERFRERYAPEVVARRYAELFRQAAKMR